MTIKAPITRHTTPPSRTRKKFTPLATIAVINVSVLQSVLSLAQIGYKGARTNVTVISV